MRNQRHSLRLGSGNEGQATIVPRFLSQYGECNEQHLNRGNSITVQEIATLINTL